MTVCARVLFPALALAAAIAWTVTPGGAQTAAPPAQSDQDHSAHHPGESTAPAPVPGGMPFGAAGMMGGGMGGTMTMMDGMMAGNPAMMASHIEGRIAFLRTELKITDAQTAQWTRFADALRSTASSMNGMHQQMMQAGMPHTLPGRLDLHETMLSSHLEALKALRLVLDPLYASFSDEQKQLADELMLSPMGVM